MDSSYAEVYFAHLLTKSSTRGQSIHRSHYFYSPEDEGVLPLPASSSSPTDLHSLAVVLVTVLDDDERQFPPLEVELDDLLPEEEPDLLLALVHQHASRRQAQRVLRPVLALRLKHEMLFSMKMVAEADV